MTGYQRKNAGPDGETGEETEMCRVISVCNQKGGVGKSAISCNLGVGLARKGKKVCIIDTDPQGNATFSLGIDNRDKLENTVSSFIEREINEDPIPAKEYVIHNEEVDIIPCNIELASYDYAMMTAYNREHMLENLVKELKKDYDYILIDCSPSLNLMTINVLTCSDSVIIPVEPATLSIEGLQLLIESIRSMKKKLNRKLKIEGIVINNVEFRQKEDQRNIEELQEIYGDKIRIFDSMIPKSVRMRECTAHGVSIFRYDPNGKATQGFEDLSEEVLAYAG